MKTIQAYMIVLPIALLLSSAPAHSMARFANWFKKAPVAAAKPVQDEVVAQSAYTFVGDEDLSQLAPAKAKPYYTLVGPEDLSQLAPLVIQESSMLTEVKPEYTLVGQEDLSHLSSLQTNVSPAKVVVPTAESQAYYENLALPAIPTRTSKLATLKNKVSTTFNTGVKAIKNNTPSKKAIVITSLVATPVVASVVGYKTGYIPRAITALKDIEYKALAESIQHGIVDKYNTYMPHVSPLAKTALAFCNKHKSKIGFGAGTLAGIYGGYRFYKFITNDTPAFTNNGESQEEIATIKK